MPSSRNNREWTRETTDLLNRVRLNSIALSEYHRKRFYYYKGFSKYFDLPILVLSILGSSFSVGMQGYLEQDMISAVSCLIGVVVSIITSIKLYLNVDTSMQNELKMSKEFYTLGIDIFKMLTLTCVERGENGSTYLQKVYGIYMKLVENSHLLTMRFKGDQLTPTEDDDLMNEDIFSVSTPRQYPRYGVGKPTLMKIPTMGSIVKMPRGKAQGDELPTLKRNISQESLTDSNEEKAVNDGDETGLNLDQLVIRNDETNQSL